MKGTSMECSVPSCHNPVMEGRKKCEKCVLYYREHARKRYRTMDPEKKKELIAKQVERQRGKDRSNEYANPSALVMTRQKEYNSR